MYIIHDIWLFFEQKSLKCFSLGSLCFFPCIVFVSVSDLILAKACVYILCTERVFLSKILLNVSQFVYEPGFFGRSEGLESFTQGKK